MAHAANESPKSTSFLSEVTARLSEAARTRAPLEVLFAVRGRVEPVTRKNGERWRLRTGRGHVVTFRPEFVVAFNGFNDVHPATPQSCDGTTATGHR
jgi:hypothetical protein